MLLFFFLMIRQLPIHKRSDTLFPYTSRFRSMTDDVAALCLEDNRLQALALSIAEKGGAGAVPSLVRIMETFEGSGRLDRKVEGLAANDELLRRAQEGRGLTRPELAVLLATERKRVV